MKSLRTAVSFLTVVPVGRTEKAEPELMASSTAFYPLVGLMIGALLMLLDNALSLFLQYPARDGLMVAALALMTGGLHLDGLADTADGFIGGKGDREKSLTIMKDSRLGSMGAATLVVVLITKYAALRGIHNGNRPGALFLAPALARYAATQVMYRARPARQGEGLLFDFLIFIRPKYFYTALLTALAAALIVARLRGFLALLAVIVAAYLLKKFFCKNFGGITGDMVGAATEVIEVIAFLALGAAVQ